MDSVTKTEKKKKKKKKQQQKTEVRHPNYQTEWRGGFNYIHIHICLCGRNSNM